MKLNYPKSYFESKIKNEEGEIGAGNPNFNKNMNLEELKLKIEKLASKNAGMDKEDFYAYAYDYSGGNFDDAYQIGLNDGEILLARELMSYLK